MKPQVHLIDTDSIETNYKKTDWADIACLVVAAFAISYVIAHVVAFVNSSI